MREGNARLGRAEAGLSLVGNTPIVPLEMDGFRILVKCEFRNPSGSIKDRFAKAVLIDAEQRGLLQGDSIILECSSGNTGIAMSMIGRAMGYGVTILMSAGASEERRLLIRQLGAELILFESEGRYQTGIDMSREMAKRDKRYFLPRQFENPINLEDHDIYTGAELIEQIKGPIDAFVTGYGTGGTLGGVGKAIKRKYPNAKIYAMEPAEQALLAGEMPCCHLIEGVADGFIPELLREAPLDSHLEVTSREAVEMTQRLHREFGLLVGASSGANVVCALRLARDLGPDGTVATLLCDRAERYFSTPLFDPARAAAPSEETPPHPECDLQTAASMR